MHPVGGSLLFQDITYPNYHMKTILVPTDFSYVSLKALEVALSLASKLKARLFLCHVYREPMQVPFMLGPMYAQTASEVREQLMLKLKQQARQARQDEQIMLPVRYLVKCGDTIEELLQVIEEKTVDLVVMGTQQGPSFLDKLFGSTTEQLLRQASCPVLAVPEGAKKRQITNILYAYDLESEMLGVMSQLFQIKSLFKAAVVVLHVQTGHQPETQLSEELKDSLFEDFAGNDFSFVEIHHKHVTAGIVKYVKKHGIDVIAFAEEQRNSWDEVRLTSTSSMLLYTLDVPVLVIPKHKTGALATIFKEHQQAQKAPDIIFD